jgi:SPP1 family predicted phage head-tail adaptor
MSYQPGLYDRLITIQENTQTTSSTTGAKVNSWSTFRTIPTRRIINSGTETVLGDRRENDFSITFEVPYYPGINPKMRVLYEEQVYNINAVVEIGRKEKLRILTELVQQVYD